MALGRQQAVVLHQHAKLVADVSLELQPDADRRTSLLARGFHRLLAEQRDADTAIVHPCREQEGDLMQPALPDVEVQQDRLFDRAVGDADVGRRIAGHDLRQEGQPQRPAVVRPAIVQGQRGHRVLFGLQPSSHAVPQDALAVDQPAGLDLEDRIDLDRDVAFLPLDVADLNHRQRDPRAG